MSLRCIPTITSTCIVCGNFKNCAGGYLAEAPYLICRRSEFFKNFRILMLSFQFDPNFFEKPLLGNKKRGRTASAVRPLYAILSTYLLHWPIYWSSSSNNSLQFICHSPLYFVVEFHLTCSDLTYCTDPCTGAAAQITLCSSSVILLYIPS